MCLIAGNKKAFVSALKNKVKKALTSNINKVKFPSFILDAHEDMFEQLVIELSNKYASKPYKNLEREDLYKNKEWSDFELLCLLMFFKKGWSIKVENSKQYFPSFVFTYDMNTLEKEIENTITKAIQIINPLNLESIFKIRKSFSALDITYLLYYFELNYIQTK